MATCDLCGKDAGYLSSLCDECKATRTSLAMNFKESAVEVPHLEAADQDNRNFFIQLINGDFGLAKTYWLFGVLVGIAVNLMSRAVPGVGVLILLTLAYTAYEIVVLIGTWRAANRYRGPGVWVLLAKVAVIFGSVVLVTGVLMIVSLFGRV